MRHERKASLLFLISLLLFLILSAFMGVIVTGIAMIFPNANVNDITYLLNALTVSLPAFFIPAVVFRRVTKMPKFKAPRFTHVLMAIGIGIGCLQLNQSLSSLTSAIFYNVELNSLSTTSETVTNLNGFNMLFSLAIIPPLSEEFLMRGTLLESWRKASPVGAMILTSLLFALLHSAPTSIPVYFAIGMLLAAVYMITRNVWLTVTVHLVNNLGSVIGALILKYGGDALSEAMESTAAAATEPVFEIASLVTMSLMYAVGAAVFLVPLLIGLRAVYKKNRLGAFSDLPAGETAAGGLSGEATQEALPEPVQVMPEKKVSLPADPFLWISLTILIILNAVSLLVELGIIAAPGLS